MRRVRRLPLLLAAVGVAALVLPDAAPFSRRLVWNNSASVPLGLYAVGDAGALTVSDLVIVQPPAELEAQLVARGTIAPGVRLVKRVAALPPQTVCRSGSDISIDGARVAAAQVTDRRGRTLPSWQGCRTLGADAVFLLNADAPDSFDGRYFGPLPRSAVVGRAIPLWTFGGPKP